VILFEETLYQSTAAGTHWKVQTIFTYLIFWVWSLNCSSIAFTMFSYHVNCFVITLLSCLLLYIVNVWYMIYHQLLTTCFFIMSMALNIHH
jgi:hypothetical protein